MNTLILFASTFGVVFFLGFQSLCVNSGNYWLAGFNSTLIGTMNLVLFKTVPNVHLPLDIAAYVFGGPLGIWSAMYVHRNVIPAWKQHLAYRAQRKRFRMIAEICEQNGFKQVG